MNLFSTLRAAHYLAADILPALRRFAAPVPDDADPYAEQLARAHAELPGTDCGLGEADECLCDGKCATDECICPVDDQDRPVCIVCGAYPHIVDCPVGGIIKFSPPSPPSASDEPAFTAWCAQIDARLAAIQDHLTSAAPGATFTPDAAPESPAPDTGAGAGHPGFPNWCAAEMRQVADILLNADSPFALGYANDLRSAADALGNDDHGSERVSWPWPDENERSK